MVNGKKIFLTTLFVFAFVFRASTAFAHKFVLTPENFDAALEEENAVYGTFTEIIGTPEYSFSMTGTIYNPMEVSVEIVYNDGSASLIAEDTFEPYDSRAGNVVAVEESDCDYAPFTLTKDGTAVLHGKFRGTIDLSQFGGSGTATSVSHVKTFLNLTADGTAGKRLGGDGVLEVVFAEEIPKGGLVAGKEVRFKFYHLGAPMANKPVFAAYSGAPVHTIDENGQEVEVNDYLEATTDQDGEAVFLLDRAAPWFVGAFAGEGTSEEYGGGIIFNAARNNESGGGGGCDSGAVSWSVFGLLAGIAAFLSRKK